MATAAQLVQAAVVLAAVAFGFFTSMNQALVGAMAGAGFARGRETVHLATLLLDPPGLGARPGASRSRPATSSGCSSARASRTARSASTTGGIELRPGAASELGHRGLVRERAAVGAVGRHRAPGIARADDARDERDLLAGEPVGIAVPSQCSWQERTMRPDLAEQPAGTLEHLLAEDRVRRSSARARSSSSGPGLLMISGGILILPTSWRSAVNSAIALLVGVEPEPLGDGEDELDDVPAVRRPCTRRPPRSCRRAGYDVPLVRVLQLEHLVVLLLPLPRRRGRRSARIGMRSEQRRRMAVRGEGGEQAERREHEIEAAKAGACAQLRSAAERERDDRPRESRTSGRSRRRIAPPSAAR